jgi:hypothetical protein
MIDSESYTFWKHKGFNDSTCLETMLRKSWRRNGVRIKHTAEILQRTLDYDFDFHREHGYLPSFSVLVNFGFKLAEKWEPSAKYSKALVETK